MNWDIEVREKVYQRLANEIFFRILHGEYGLGTKMPSYTELSKTAGSSPETVRKVFSELCRLGLIDKTRYGYFVTSNHGHISSYRQNYLADLEKEYLVAKTKVCIVSDGEINPFKKDQ